VLVRRGPKDGKVLLQQRATAKTLWTLSVGKHGKTTPALTTVSVRTIFPGDLGVVETPMALAATGVRPGDESRDARESSEAVLAHRGATTSIHGETEE